MKIGLIGLGMVAPTYLDAVSKAPNLEIGPVFARTPEARRQFVDAHPEFDLTIANSIDELAQSDIDFAVITTPPNARTEIVEKLARAGKPILMEKPIERDLEAATRIVEICEKAGIPLGIMLQHRARPVVADLRSRLPGFGPLSMAEIVVPWWRAQSYYDAPGRGSYARDGGGVLISQAIHTLDLMLTLTGPVLDVTAFLATTSSHKMEAEDFATAGIRFENGAVGHVFATTASFPGKGEEITLHFEKASVRLAAGVLQVDYRDGQSEHIGQAAASGAGADPMAFTSDWHRYVIEDFADSLRNRRAPLITGRSALEVHRLIAAMELSGREGRKIAIKEVS